MGASSGAPQPKKVPPQLYIADPATGHFPGQAAVYVSEVPPKQEFEVCCNEHTPSSYVHQKNITSPKGNPPFRSAVVYNFEQNLPNHDSDVPCNFRSRPSNVEVIKNRLSGNPRHSNWDLFDSDEVTTVPPPKVHNWQRGPQPYEPTKKLNTERHPYDAQDLRCQTDDASNGNGIAVDQKLNPFSTPFSYSAGGSLESLKQPKKVHSSPRILPGIPVRNVGGSYNDIYRFQVSSFLFTVCLSSKKYHYNILNIKFVALPTTRSTLCLKYCKENFALLNQ